MAHTIIDHVGNSTQPSISGSDNRAVAGPPVRGASNYRGIFTRQSGSAGAYTYRWVEDEPYNGTVTSYSMISDHRS